jgi:hypothetical protein
MKGDSDKEKTETIMALRLKLDSQIMDIEEKSIISPSFSCLRMFNVFFYILRRIHQLSLY